MTACKLLLDITHSWAALVPGDFRPTTFRINTSQALLVINQ